VPQSVDAPSTGPLCGDVKKDETVDDHEFTAILKRPEASRCMDHEVGGGHLTTGDKGGNTGDPSDGDQQATDKLDHPGKSHKGKKGHGGSRFSADTSQHAKELLRTVTGKENANDDPHEGIQVRGEWFHNSSHVDFL
jgi:hypothetical protein